MFSIIIPTYNRPEPLAECLEALSRMTYERDKFEVIVVDDGGDTALDDVIRWFRDRFALTLLTQANAGPAAARNAGAAQAKGDYLAFTDDDCQPAADWLLTLEKCFAQFPQAAVTGNTINLLPDNLYAHASQLLIDYLYEHFNADPHHAQFLTSNNLALSTEQFRALGGFDTTFPNAAGEDREFCDRWLHQGNQVVFAPEVLIYHAHHLTLRTFWKQHFHYGRGAFRFHQILARRKGVRMKVEPFRFYADLLYYPLAHARGSQIIWIVFLFFLSQVANTSGFFWERKKAMP